MKANNEKFPSLSFDGCGINGRDEYRTRICTFDRDNWDKEAKEFGQMFAAAPEMLARLGELVHVLENTANKYEANGRMTRSDVASLRHWMNEARAAIAKAKGGAI